LLSGPIPKLGDGPEILFDRITENEEINTHNDFLHRYHYVQGTSSYYGSLTPGSGGTDAGELAGDPYYWLTPFRAYRGSVRLCSVDSVICHGLSLAIGQNSTTVQSSGVFTASNLSSDTPVEIPYNNNVRFLPLRLPEATYPDAYDRYYISNTTGARYTMWAAGDDFTIGLRRSPMLIPA